MKTNFESFCEKAEIPFNEVNDIDLIPLKENFKADLFSYEVPVLSPDGSCSANKGLADEPYDLREILNIRTNEDEARIKPKLVKLYSIINGVQQELKADWIGIYQVAKKTNDIDVLVKLAYQGSPSRAEFPLTPEFAQLSNNSTVGISGKGIVINNISEHEGAYYVCDSEVNSEVCLPIYNHDLSEVIGIVDAESFKVDHFSDRNIALVAKLCFQLSDYLPL